MAAISAPAVGQVGKIASGDSASHTRKASKPWRMPTSRAYCRTCLLRDSASSGPEMEVPFHRRHTSSGARLDQTKVHDAHLVRLVPAVGLATKICVRVFG